MADRELRKSEMMAHLLDSLGLPCNVYKDLQFPQDIYEHISECYEQKASSWAIIVLQECSNSFVSVETFKLQ